MSYLTAIEIDNGAPSDRVDVIQLSNELALVTWVERIVQGEFV